MARAGFRGTAGSAQLHCGRGVAHSGTGEVGARFESCGSEQNRFTKRNSFTVGPMR